MRWRSDLGAVAVETALISAFVLVPLLVGVVDLGRALYVSITIEEVAQEAAVFAAFEGVDLDATKAQAIAATSFPVLDVDDISAVCTSVSRLRAEGSDVTVNIEYELDTFFLPNLVLRQSATAEGVRPCGFSS